MCDIHKIINANGEHMTGTRYNGIKLREKKYIPPASTCNVFK